MLSYSIIMTFEVVTDPLLEEDRENVVVVYVLSQTLWGVLMRCTHRSVNCFGANKEGRREGEAGGGWDGVFVGVVSSCFYLFLVLCMLVLKLHALSIFLPLVFYLSSFSFLNGRSLSTSYSMFLVKNLCNLRLLVCRSSNCVPSIIFFFLVKDLVGCGTRFEADWYQKEDMLLEKFIIKLIIKNNIIKLIKVLMLSYYGLMC